MYTATLEMRKQTIMTIPDIDIAPGKTNNDPRLQGIDLTGKIQSTKLLIQFTDQNKKFHRVTISTGKETFHRPIWEDGRLTLCFVKLPAKLKVTIKGYLPITLIDPGESHELLFMKD